MFEAEQYARKLTPRDRAYIDSAFRAIKLGYEGTVEVECPKCGRVITIPFEINGDTILLFQNQHCGLGSRPSRKWLFGKIFTFRGTQRK